MKLFQKELHLSPKKRGFHLITKEIEEATSKEMQALHMGILNIFIKHTSASITINENVDYSVRGDMESFFSDIIDDKPYFEHTYEGADDMPAHIKSSMLGTSLNIPITNGKLNLGIWQGIYLCEHRDFASQRSLVLTIQGQ